MRWLRAWDQFWFGSVSVYGLTWMRWLFGSTVFYMYFRRLWNLDYYTEQSWVPADLALKVLPEVYRPAFAWFWWPDVGIPFLHSLMLLTLLVWTLGLLPKWAHFICGLVSWLLLMGFMQRNYTVNFGADVMAAMFMFYLLGVEPSQKFMLKAHERSLFFKEVSKSFLTPVMLRLMQIQISTIYVYSGFEKLKGQSWWNGTAVWDVLNNSQMTPFDFSFLRNYGYVIVILTGSTVLFEIYFPVLMLSNKTRRFCQVFGVLFHLGIGFVLGLLPFSLIMLSTYFLSMNVYMNKKSVTQ